MAELDVESMKKREAYIKMEFCRIARNALSSSTFSETSSSVEEVLPEVPVGDKKADIVLLGKHYNRP